MTPLRVEECGSRSCFPASCSSDQRVNNKILTSTHTHTHKLTDTTHTNTPHTQLSDCICRAGLSSLNRSPDSRQVEPFKQQYLWRGNYEEKNPPLLQYDFKTRPYVFIDVNKRVCVFDFDWLWKRQHIHPADLSEQILSR